MNISRLTLITIIIVLLASHVDAACSDPLGEEGTLIYNNTYKIVQFCNGTNWVNASSNSPIGNSTFGALVAGNLCTTDGTVINCNVPSISNSMLAGNIAASKLVGTDISTVGTITSGIWNAGAITSSGTITGNLFSGDGSALTNLNASNLASGTVPAARLGTGSAGSTTFLRGDGSWAAVAAGGSNSQVQFNNSGALAGSANFAWNNSTSALTLTGTANITTVNASNVAATGTMSAATPVASTDVATKAYVDTAVAAASGGTNGRYQTACAMYGANGFCLRTDTQTGAVSCQYTSGSGYNSWSTCSTSPAFGSSGGNDALPVGYFVRTYSSWDGNLGGLSGANAKCLSDLAAYPWNGKSDASARGLLTSAKVRAFLCSSTTCQNPQAFTDYHFAYATNILVGGASYPSGIDPTQWPGDASSWYSGTTLGGVGPVTIWTGRSYASNGDTGVGNTPNGNTCANWTSSSSSSSGRLGYLGYSGSTSGWRWSNTNNGCDAVYPLVCFVDP